MSPPQAPKTTAATRTPVPIHKNSAPKESANKTPSPSKPKEISIALQGGGAHGAFAWGVLDCLLEDGRLTPNAVVGTSAGAMNASVLAHGLERGGNEYARTELRKFWEKVSKASLGSPMQPTFFDRVFSPGNINLSPGWIFHDMVTRNFSPYQLNPLNSNPLRKILGSIVDFQALQHTEKVKLFICASNVLSGRIKVFSGQDISLDAVMASACLPEVFQAVEVKGEYYWDGGYMGNPPLYPLFYHTDCRDVLIIQINPINITELPTTAHTISDRVNTLSFNSSLMREMRTINFVSNLIESGYDRGGTLKKINIHTIDAEDVMQNLGVSSKLNADWSFLTHLFEIGRERTRAFLDQHYKDVGERSTTDIKEKFL